MKSLNTKLILSTFGVVAMLTTSPALAKKPHPVTYNNGSAVYNAIPGYDRDGAVVAIPDQSGASQR